MRSDGMGNESAEFLQIFQKQPTRAKGVWVDHSIPGVWTERIDGIFPGYRKPVNLQRRLISAVTNKGDFVIDPAAGSFSVMVAALAEGRNFIGCDVQGEGDEHD